MSKGRPRSSLGDSASAIGASLLLVSIAAAFAPGGAIAQQRAGDGVSGESTTARSGGWYGGLSIGGAPTGIRESVLPTIGATVPNLSRTDFGTGYKLYGGYHFNRNFALEGGYTDFGNFSFGREIDAPVFGAISNNVRSSGLHLDAVGIVPLHNGFSLFGKIGTIYTMPNNSISTSTEVVPLPTLSDMNPRRSEWNSRYSLGASYDLSKNLGLRFGYERFNNLGDVRTGDGNVGIWSFGFTKRY